MLAQCFEGESIRDHINACFSMSRLKDVEKRTENVNTDEDPSGWRPYFAFVDTLREKYDKDEALQGIPMIALWVFSAVLLLELAF